MSARKQKKITSEELRNKLKLKHFEARRKISEKHPHVGEIFKQKGEFANTRQKY